jgi:hypothetical protein
MNDKEETSLTNAEHARRRFDALISFVTALGYDPDEVVTIQVKVPYITVRTKPAGPGVIRTERNLFIRRDEAIA